MHLDVDALQHLDVAVRLVDVLHADHDVILRIRMVLPPVSNETINLDRKSVV